MTLFRMKILSRHILLLSIYLVSGEGISVNPHFAITPKDVTFYYDSVQVLHQFCAPSDPNSLIKWFKNDKQLKTNDRIKQLINPFGHDWMHMHLNKSLNIYELRIDPVMKGDIGKYHCMSRDTYGEYIAKFTVNITDDCGGTSFKCRQERKCILSSFVCDGKVHCKDESDESFIRAGCMPPATPSIKSITRDSTSVKVYWNKVPTAIKYQLKLIPYNNKHNSENNNNELRLVNSSSRYSSMTIHRLIPNTVYNISMRAIAITGKSLYSPTVLVQTMDNKPPEVPKNPRSLYQTVNTISYKWDPVVGATSYVVELLYLTGEKKYHVVFPTLSEVVINNLRDGEQYMLRVRAKSSFGYSNYSAYILVTTPEVGPPGAPTNVMKEVNGQDVTLFWEHTKTLRNTRAYELTYIVGYCVLNGYERINCKQSETFRDFKLKLTHLRAHTTYWYNITTYGLNHTPGGVTTGNFTTTMYTTKPPTTEYNPFVQPSNQFSGIVVFGIMSGALLVLLFFSFCFAYACKWKPLVDAMDEYKAKESKCGESTNIDSQQNSLLKNYNNL